MPRAIASDYDDIQRRLVRRWGIKAADFRNPDVLLGAFERQGAGGVSRGLIERIIETHRMALERRGYVVREIETAKGPRTLVQKGGKGKVEGPIRVVRRETPSLAEGVKGGWGRSRTAVQRREGNLYTLAGESGQFKRRTLIERAWASGYLSRTPSGRIAVRGVAGSASRLSSVIRMLERAPR